jgi:hypothetical protein
MIGAVVNGALVILWLTVWALGGGLFVVPLVAAALCMVLCFVVDVIA